MKATHTYTLAADVARQLGIVRSGANVRMIQLAIKSEADFSGVPAIEAASVIVRAAREWSRRPEYSCLASWEEREMARENTVDRFWFEDARWRTKLAYVEFASEQRDRAGP
jgi:hypothetical protein